MVLNDELEERENLTIELEVVKSQVYFHGLHISIFRGIKPG
jgi:hypothetical protein